MEPSPKALLAVGDSAHTHDRILDRSARFSRALQLIEGEALITLALEPNRERAATAVLEMVKRAHESAARSRTASSRRAA